MTAAKDVLVQRLAALLGFEEGAGDVLEHLLTISSSDDLLDYLSQLLGRKDDDVQTFVQDVVSFRQGDPLSAAVVDKQVEQDTVPVARPERTYEATAKSKADKRKDANRKDATHAKQSKSPPRSKSPKPTTAIKPPSATAGTKQIPVSKEPAAAANIKSSAPPKKTNPSQSKPTPPVKSHPPRGKASVVCGCFGSLHKPLTNCLYCGRISCQREGYDYCPFCGFLVEQVRDTDGEGKAWEHKERLLRFDREFARRTVVLDDQADYFTTSDQTWLTEDERKTAQQKDAEHQEQLQRRGKQTLDISF